MVCLSEFNYLFNFKPPEVLFEYYLDVAVVSRTFDAVVNGRQAEAHVVDAEISEAGIFAIDNLDCTFFPFVSSLVDNKEVTSCENEFRFSLAGSFVVGPGVLFPAASSPAKAHVMMETGAR